MKLKTKDLKEKMNLLKPVFSKNDLSGFGEYVFLRKGKIYGLSGNVKIFVNYPELENEDLIILPNQELNNFINKVKTDEIEFKNDKDSITIVSGKTKAQFVKLDLFSDEVSEDIECNTKYRKIPEGFFEAIKLCLFSVLRNGNSVLSNIYVKDYYIVSSDNYRISLYEMKDKIEIEMLLPADSVKEILKYSDISKYGIDGSYIYFTNEEENLMYGFSLGFGEYHDFYDYFSDIEENNIKIDLNSDILWNNDIVSVFTDNEADYEKAIKVEIKDKNIKFTGENKKGIIESESKIDIDQDIKFIINPVFLSQVSKICKTMLIKDELAIFVSDNYKHLFTLGEWE